MCKVYKCLSPVSFWLLSVALAAGCLVWGRCLQSADLSPFFFYYKQLPLANKSAESGETDPKQ